MALDRSRPEILAPPAHPPACCTQQTITAGPQVAAKTRQKHDYPSAAWRISYHRRTAAERLNAAIKDTAVNSIDRGWIPLTGITPLMLWITCLLALRNQRTLTTWHTGSKTTPPQRRTATTRNPQTPAHHPRRPRGAALTTAAPSPAAAPLAETRPPAKHPVPRARHPPPPTTQRHPGAAQDHFNADAGMSVPDVNMDLGEV